MPRGVGHIAFLAGPLLWITVANLAPLLEMARISLLDAYPVPPGQKIAYGITAYAAFLGGTAYQAALLRSVVFAALTTAGSLLLCFPLAYYIVRTVPAERRVTRLMLLVAPFWTSEIVRTFAIALLLSNRGAVNMLLWWLGVVDAPLPLLYGAFSVAFGMLYVALLSMLLPLYAALSKLPQDVLEVASDLGASPWQRLFAVTLPLCAGGIGSGCGLVFLLSLGALAVPVLLGGPNTTLFAVTVSGFFGNAANGWPIGAAFSLILLAVGGVAAGAMVGLGRRRVSIE